MIILRVIILTSFMIFIGGCNTTKSPKSYVEQSIKTDDINIMVGDIVGFIEENFPPEETFFVLHSPTINGKHDYFTQKLVPTLQEKGFGVEIASASSSKDRSNSIDLRYYISNLGSGILLRIEYRDSGVSRYYSRDADGQLIINAPFVFREN